MDSLQSHFLSNIYHMTFTIKKSQCVITRPKPRFHFYTNILLRINGARNTSHLWYWKTSDFRVTKTRRVGNGRKIWAYGRYNY